MKILQCYIFSLVFYMPTIFGQQITIDGHTDDWSESQLIATDLEIGSQFDIERLYMDYDASYLYLRVDVSEKIILQRESELVFIIDSDNNNDTGFPIKGLGTEFSFYFTGNNGFVNPVNNSISINHDDVGFFVAPAFESKSFEFAIDRNLGSYGPTLDGIINIAIFNNIPGGDILPNSNGLQIDLSPDVMNEFDAFIIDKPETADFRMLSFNTKFDQIFETAAFEPYQRIFKATNPDIIAFQEIYDHSSAQTADLVESMNPSPDGLVWYHEQVGADIILLSRYPIVFDDWVSGNGAFVIDVNGQEVLILNVHLPCCDNDQDRDEEIDGILRYLRNTMNGIGDYDLPTDSPYFIVGDFNLVGNGDQLNRLLTGDIKNNVIFGEDFQPDWFSGDLVDAAPKVINSNLAHTWYNRFSNYTGGRLDYVLSTPSAIHEVNKYVIDTRLMSQSDLFLTGLSQDDSEDCSDHLAVVSDWSFSPLSSSSDLTFETQISIYPLPFADQLNIDVLDNQQMSQIRLLDLNGRLVQTYRSIYARSFSLSSPDLHPGLYLLEILMEDGSRAVFPITK